LLCCDTVHLILKFLFSPRYFLIYLDLICLNFYLAFASQKSEAQTYNTTVELAFEKLKRWLLRKRTKSWKACFEEILQLLLCCEAQNVLKGNSKITTTTT
jgi:hypothetical protein